MRNGPRDPIFEKLRKSDFQGASGWGAEPPFPHRKCRMVGILSAHGGATIRPYIPTPGESISACGTISSPGSYVLTGNLSSSGDCLRVRSDDVTIDFDGFVMTGDGTGDGISVDGTRFTVRNGTIRKFGIGIGLLSYSLLDVPGNVIERMRIADMAGWGIGGGSAVVRDSVFTGNGNTAMGLNEGSLVTGNRVVGNKAGIAVAQGSTVSGNVVYSNSMLGINVTCPSLLLGNTSTGSATNLWLNGTGCTAEHNVAP
jgi:hypothetical protein